MERWTAEDEREFARAERDRRSMMRMLDRLALGQITLATALRDMRNIVVAGEVAHKPPRAPRAELEE